MDGAAGRGRHVADAPIDDVPVVRIGRHAPVPADSGRRSADKLDDPANTGPIMVPTGRARLVARLSAATAAVAAVGVAGYAAAMPGPLPVGMDKPVEPVQTSQLPIVVPKRVLTEPRVVVKALPKPRAKARPAVVAPAPAVRVVPAPQVVPVAPAAPRIIPAPVAPRVVAPPVRIVPAPQPVPVVPARPVVPTLPKPVPPATSKAAQIAAAARAQLGRFQDCTMLVTNALATVGIRYHGWPAGYFSLGRVVAPAEAVEGDLVYYQNGGMGVAHIAVFVGNGQAVHGGWNGNNTVLFSSQVGSGPVFIRVY